MSDTYKNTSINPLTDDPDKGSELGNQTEIDPTNLPQTSSLVEIMNDHKADAYGPHKPDNLALESMEKEPSPVIVGFDSINKTISISLHEGEEPLIYILNDPNFKPETFLFLIEILKTFESYQHNGRRGEVLLDGLRNAIENFAKQRNIKLQRPDVRATLLIHSFNKLRDINGNPIVLRIVDLSEQSRQQLEQRIVTSYMVRSIKSAAALSTPKRYAIFEVRYDANTGKEKLIPVTQRGRLVINRI